MTGWAALGVVVLAVANLSVAAEDATPVKIATKSATDVVDVEARPDQTLLSIRSQSGIGQAVMQRTSASWPAKIVLRLHLQGLENLRVAAGGTQLEASVSSHDGQTRVWKAGEEHASLTAASPFWLDLQRRDADGKPTAAIPLRGGYFEIVLPKALFEHNPPSFTIAWIDFYRS